MVARKGADLDIFVVATAAISCLQPVHREMAEPGPDLAAKAPVQTRTALTRKHLRRDQAAARKSKSKTIAADSIKERQQKLKEEREAKRATLDTRHQHIFGTVATKLRMKDSEIEDFILEKDQLEYMDSFFAQNGSKCLLFYYEEIATEENDKKKITKNLYLTDGTKEAFPGVGLFFLRTTAKPLTTANIASETFFGALESNGGGLLEAIETLLASVFLPALKEQTNWGALSADADGHMQKEAFINKLASFIAVLANARASIADAVKLSPCTHEGLTPIKTPAEILAAAGNPELVEAAEACTLVWCKEVEQILTKSEQMRREADDVGPRAELEHWKKRMAKFDSLTTCIKSPQCRAIINILVAAKSKVLQTWKELDITITDYTNEAKDNVKFLYTLERYCEPLYNCNPVTMLDSIPGLMNAIRMINSYSRYYNTSEQMTALFVKVTNQMITACRAHITDSGFHSVWDQERNVVLKKLADCKRLNQEYQLCFQRTKEKLKEHPEEKPFDFSEMYIFGKFNNFTRRIDNIVDFLKITGTYETLGLSRIEGIETYHNRFSLLVNNIKKKLYDPLEHRKKDFDVDYEDFKAQLKDLEAQLQGHMEQFFENASSAQRAIEFTQRFERLKLPCLNILGKWKLAVSLFVKDLHFVQSEYNKHKEDPPLARNLPPISGKIAWARQLYRRISSPVAVFQKNPQLLQLPETKKAIKHYNRLARVLVEYELVFLQMWSKQIDSAKTCFNSTVLVKHPDTGELLVNFDPKINEVLREIEVLTKMGLEIPPQAKPFIGKRAEMREKFDQIDVLVQHNKHVRDKIPEILLPLMAPHTEKVDEMLSPGLTLLPWTSLNLGHFADSCMAALDKLELLIDRARDIVEIQIEGVLREITTTLICVLPENEPWTIEEFISKIKGMCDKYGPKLSTSCKKIEKAIYDLLTLILPEGEEDLQEVLKLDNVRPTSGKTTPKILSLAMLSPVEEEEEELRPGEITRQRQEQRKKDLLEEAKYLLDHYSKQTLMALIKCTRYTLETIKRRVSSPSAIQYGDAAEDRKKIDYRPAIKVKLVLAIPHVGLKPALDEIQGGLNTVVQNILAVHKNVMTWGQKEASLVAPSGVLTAQSKVLTASSKVLAAPSVGPGTLNAVSGTFGRQKSVEVKSFFKAVSEHKEIVKLVSLMTSTISSAKVLITQSLERFKEYEELWTIDGNEFLTKFMEEDPSLSDFEAKLKEYTAMDDVINEEEELLSCGALALTTEDLKIAMKAEAKGWKVQFARHMNTKYVALMDKIMEMIDDYSKRLSRPIKDLDDVRQAMAALKEVRENEIFIDTSLDPIEESYSLMMKYQIQVAREETEKVDTMRFAWQKLNTLAGDVQNHLIKIQSSFRGDLLTKVETFQTETSNFYHAYETEGPMVEDISPREASDRVNIFQTQFDELWRKYQIYSDGEELFGLPVTDYNELSRIKKEFNLLQKLYGLYNNVMDCINGYYDILWVEVDIEKINNELLDFQNKCRKLPKALKEWQAFNELKKKIDDFNETCPLLEMMSNKAMLERHWKRMEEVTSHTFDVESESFQLRNIMEAPILKFREDIELPPRTLAEILAPSSLMLGHKFELSVDEWTFIGHPFSVQSDSFSITFNVVFVFLSSCSPAAIEAYDHLSHMIGSAIVHEEKRCGYLREQVALLMNLLEVADIPDPSADTIIDKSSLAKTMNKVLCSLQNGKKYIQVCINSWSEVNTLLVSTSKDTPAPPKQLCVRSYSALLLFEGVESLLKSLPSSAGNSAMHRFLQACSPMKSLQAVSLDADIPLHQTLHIASHLVTWGRSMAIYPLSESNMYITSPTCNTRVESRLAQHFSAAFPSPAPSLPEVLSHFSLPISLGDLKETISDERIIQITVWLLQHKQIIQLHTYVYIVPTTPSEGSPSHTSSAGFGNDHAPISGYSPSGSGMQLEDYVGGAEGAALLAHLPLEERQSVLRTAAAQDPEDLEQFARLSQYFHGDHHLEGIMLMENIPRSQLLTLIDKFSEVLVTCTLPEHSITGGVATSPAGGVVTPSGR